MIELMVDLETLDTRPSAVVLSLGAVKFRTFATPMYSPGKDVPEPELDYEIVDRFMRVFRIDEQTAGLRTISESTLLWWQGQDPTAKAEAFNPVRQSVAESLGAFYGWVDGELESITRFWASPATFDFPIIESLAEQFGCSVPWTYRQKYDVRTVVNEVSYSASDHIPLKNVIGIPHTPVYDCEWQIDLLIAARRKLRRRMGR